MPLCLVCCSETKYTCFVACGHNGICGKCHLRLRKLHKDTGCPICKTALHLLVVDVDEPVGKKLDDYQVWNGNYLGDGFVYLEDVDMFFSVGYYEAEIEPLVSFKCYIPDCAYDAKTSNTNSEGKSTRKSPLRLLKNHLKNKHKLYICHLCADNRRDFISQLPRLNSKQLDRHMKFGDGKRSGFAGHPMCQFCKPKRFYDITELHVHLNKEHYKCHVCEKAGRSNQFYKHYQSLERHFDRDHFLCRDVQCLQARFIVFDNELDLRHHERQVHGGTSTTSDKIQLEFRVGRSDAVSTDNQVPNRSEFDFDLDGQPFVPDVAPAAEASQYPLHIERTEQLRRQAAGLRPREGVPDAFPSLAGRSQSGDQKSPFQSGWTSGSVLHTVGRPGRSSGRVNVDDFPSLPQPIHISQPLRRHHASVADTKRNTQEASKWQKKSSTPHRQIVSSSPSSGRSSRHHVKPDVSEDNFPSLGPGLGKGQNSYKNARMLGRKARQQQSPSWDGFPVLQGSVRDSGPGPQRVSSDGNQRDLLATQQLSIEDLKISIGSSKYKQLRTWTREFVSGSLLPHNFADRAAGLFDSGYADPDFWNYLPVLMSSCPNHTEANQVLHYLFEMRQAKCSLNSERSTPSPARSKGVKNAWNTIS